MKFTQQSFSKANKLLQWLIVVVAIGFLTSQIYQKNHIFDDLQLLFASFTSSKTYFILIFVILLMPLNWLLESIKWKYLIRKKENLPLSDSIKGVISGITISSITPNRVGEFVARLFVLKKTRFWEGVFITILGSFSQTVVTLVFGIISISLFIWQCSDCHQQIPFFTLGSILFLGLGLLACAGIILLYFRFKWLQQFIPKKWKRIWLYSLVIKQYNARELTIVLIYSVLRYFIFSLQFVLLLIAFQLKIEIVPAFMLVFIIFFMNTVNPSIAMLELGVRGSIAIFVLKYYFTIIQKDSFEYEFETFTASGLLWLINIVIPAILGLLFVSKLNFFRFSKEKDDPQSNDLTTEKTTG